MDVPMGSTETRQGNVQVYFTTNSPDIELPEGKRQLLIPTSETFYSPENKSTYLFLLPRCTKIWSLSDPQFGFYA
jgi:hypothetical protein